MLMNYRMFDGIRYPLVSGHMKLFSGFIVLKTLEFSKINLITVESPYDTVSFLQNTMVATLPIC